MKVNCSYCKKELEREDCRIAKNKTKRFFCNQKERMAFEYENKIKDKIGIIKNAQESRRRKALERFKNNPKIRISARGYKVIYIPIMLKGGGKWKKLHHFVWENAGGEIPLGMYLHHKDGNRINNKLSNLKLISPSEHSKIHYNLSKKMGKIEKGKFIKKHTFK